jgi:predicted RNA-binding protein with PUA-like domain
MPPSRKPSPKKPKRLKPADYSDPRDQTVMVNFSCPTPFTAALEVLRDHWELSNVSAAIRKCVRLAVRQAKKDEPNLAIDLESLKEPVTTRRRQ